MGKPVRRGHVFRVIKSDTSSILWNCSICHSGPHWFIQECQNCNLKACQSCTGPKGNSKAERTACFHAHHKPLEDSSAAALQDQTSTTLELEHRVQEEAGQSLSQMNAIGLQTLHEPDGRIPDINAGDTLIAVMGPTGSGKSTFVNYLTEEDVIIGHGLEACTTNVAVHTAIGLDGGKIFLVDTPGLDDTHRSDVRVLRDLASWLTVAYLENIKLTGIVYLHPITRVRMGGSAEERIRMLEKLCGVEGLGNVVLATTMWDIVDRAAGEEREQLLLTSMKDYWGEMVQQGSKVFRQDRGAQSATEIVDYLVRRKRTVVLELQRELVDNNKYLHETEAGKVILAQYVKQRQSSEQNLERPKEDLKRALLTNDKEHQEELIEYKRESEAEMVRDEEYLRRLKVNQQQIQNEMRETVQQHRQNMQSTETKAQSLAMRHQPDMKRDRDSNDKNAVSLHASSDHYQAPIQENIPGWVIAANNDDAADVDMAAILDPSSYASKLDDLEAAVHQKCRIHDILQTESDGMLHVLPTPREGVEIALEELLLAMNLMQEQRFCTDNIIVLVQDLQRSHVVRACDISIQDVRELYELTKDRPRDTTRLRYLVNKLLRIFIQHPGLEVSATYPQLLRKPLESLCSFLRLATAVYVESHCSDLSLEDFSPAESIVYEVIDGCKYVLSRRRLACLHNFIGGPVWVFESARTSAASSLSITVEQFADLWGPLHTVSSSEGAHRPLAIHTEGGTIFRVADEKADKVQLASETSCHWMRTSPMGRSYKTTQANFLDLLCSDEEFSQELLPFSADQRLLIGHPSSSTRASTAIYNKSRTSSQPQLTISVSSDIEFSHHQECRFDFEEFGAQNAFNMRAAGTMPAYYSPNEYQLGFSAGQYVNVGLHKTWKRRPSVTYKDRIMSFCCSGSLATPERVKQVLQLLLGLEVSACTFNAQRVSLEQVIRTAFPSDANIIDQACTAGDASILATYLGELRFSGVTERENQVLLYWPLSKGIGEVFCHIDFPRWSSMLKDTPDSCCFATLSPRCLQFATNYSGRLIGSLCSPGSVYLPKSTLRSTIHVNPHECLRLPLKQGSDIAIENGSLRIHHADEKFHIAFLQHRGWKRLKTLAGRDKRNIHRELLDPSRTCKSSFEVCIMDDPAV